MNQLRRCSKRIKSQLAQTHQQKSIKLVNRTIRTNRSALTTKTQNNRVPNERSKQNYYGIYSSAKKRPRKRKKQLNCIEDKKFRETVEKLFSFITKSNIKAEQAASLINKRSVESLESGSNSYYHNCSSKRIKGAQKFKKHQLEHSFYSFKSTMPHIKEVLSRSQVNKDWLTKLQSHKDGGNKRCPESPTIDNNSHSTEEPCTQSIHNFTVQNLLSTVTSSPENLNEILKVINRIKQFKMEQMKRKKLSQSQTGFTSFSQNFPLPRAAYHIGAAYHIWYSQCKAKKEPTEYSRKVVSMIVEKTREAETNSLIQEVRNKMIHLVSNKKAAKSANNIIKLERVEVNEQEDIGQCVRETGLNLVKRPFFSVFSLSGPQLDEAVVKRIVS